MTVTVRPRSTSSSVIATNQGSRQTAAVVVKRATDITLQSLNNVNATDLQDGYTLVYDEDTQTFVTTAIENLQLNLVDGGTY